MNGASVQVPVVRPAAYLPAWAEKPPGVRVSRTLDLADLLAERRLRLVDASVALDPPLVADSFYLSDVAVTFALADTPPAAARTRWRVRFDLAYSDGSQDQVVVMQPIGAAVLTGLVPADVTGLMLSIGGDVITIGGEPVYVELGPVEATALLLSIGGEIITVGGEPIYIGLGPIDATARELSIAGEIITIGGEPIYA